MNPPTTPPKLLWNRLLADEMCREIEAVCPKFGCHVALTGGLLYKDGHPKDCDILLYRIRQAPEIDLNGLWEALKPNAFIKLKGWGWCYKCTWRGLPVDVFDPEETQPPDGSTGTDYL